MKNQLKRILRPAIRMLKPAPPYPSEPISSNWGVERGTPLGRHFIDRFMETNRRDITGVVLEIKNQRYTKSLGYDIERSDVLDVDDSNSDANIVTDLATADCVQSNTYDCFIVNETLQFVYDLKSAVGHCHRILKPGGILFVTVPCTAQHDGELKDLEMWRFTANSCRRLFGDQFGEDQVQVEPYGNFLTCTASLTGVVTEELEPDSLNEDSSMFVQGICVRARKKDGETALAS